MPIINQVVKGSGGSVPPLCMQFRNVNGTIQKPNTVMDFTGATDVGYEALKNLCYENRTITTPVTLSPLQSVSGNYGCFQMFNSCNYIPSIDVSSLVSITGDYAFGGAFAFCEAITSMSFDNLSVLSGANVFTEAFWYCSGLTTLSFPALKSTSFGLQNSQFENMLLDVDGCTVHFPSNLQSVIGSWSDVTGGFGGTNTTVLFDLPATN